MTGLQQPSLQGLSDPPWQWTVDYHSQAVRIVEEIVAYCLEYETRQWVLVLPRREYQRARILELVLQLAPSNEGKNRILQYFITCLPPPLTPPTGHDQVSDLLEAAAGFRDYGDGSTGHPVIVERVTEMADTVVDCFLIPIRAQGNKIPRPNPEMTPSTHPDAMAASTAQLDRLRYLALRRDRHRCVVSRAFDVNEANRRDFYVEKDSLGAAIDDEGTALDPDQAFDVLEVAHIMPHSLMSSSNGSMLLNDRKIYVMKLLDMLYPGVATYIEGDKIDRPGNVVTLSRSLHVLFGQMDIFFTADISQPDKYTIESVKKFLPFPLPITRELLFGPTKAPPGTDIEPPFPQLLAIHKACCLVLNLSGAAEHVEMVMQGEDPGKYENGSVADYIDRVLAQRDDDPYVQSDGSTELGTLVSARLMEQTSD